MSDDDIQTMQTGDITRRIGVPVTEALLKELGFQEVGHVRRAVLWNQDDYPDMCESIGEWIKSKRGVPMQPKPPKVEKKPAKEKADDKPAGVKSKKPAVTVVAQTWSDDEEI